MLASATLTGRRLVDSKGATERGTLSLEQHPDGRWHHFATGEIADAMETDDMPAGDAAFGVVISLVDNCIFLPDPGECERVGLPILRHPDYRCFDPEWRGVHH
jgi:hypothetical protein